MDFVLAVLVAVTNTLSSNPISEMDVFGSVYSSVYRRRNSITFERKAVISFKDIISKKKKQGVSFFLQTTRCFVRPSKGRKNLKPTLKIYCQNYITDICVPSNSCKVISDCPKVSDRKEVFEASCAEIQTSCSNAIENVGEKPEERLRRVGFNYKEVELDSWDKTSITAIVAGEKLISLNNPEYVRQVTQKFHLLYNATTDVCDAVDYPIKLSVSPGFEEFYNTCFLDVSRAIKYYPALSINSLLTLKNLEQTSKEGERNQKIDKDGEKASSNSLTEKGVPSSRTRKKGIYQSTRGLKFHRRWSVKRKSAEARKTH